MKANEIAVYFGNLVFRIDGSVDDGAADDNVRKCAKLLDGGKYIILASHSKGTYSSYLFDPLKTDVQIEPGVCGISSDSDCAPVVEATVIEAHGSSIDGLLSVLPDLKDTLLGWDA